LYADKDAATELTAVPDIFVSELYSIEEVGGGCLRFTFYSYQKSTIFKDRRREKIIVARIVMPIDAVQRACQVSVLALAGLEGIIQGVPVERKFSIEGTH
jgi:hypothetical protein